jgi:hypothetical protein
MLVVGMRPNVLRTASTPGGFYALPLMAHTGELKSMIVVVDLLASVMAACCPGKADELPII